MKRPLSFMALLICLGLSACTQPPQRAQEEDKIVSTSAAICEIMDKLELDLVGVPDSATELPLRYGAVPRVGLPMSPDMEVIAALSPSVIISPNTLQYDLKPLYDGAGFDSIFVNLGSVEGMLQSIHDLGEKYGRQQQAQAILDEHEAFMTQYSQDVAGREKPTVLLLMGVPGSYMVATEQSHIGNLVKLAGGENIYAEVEDAFIVISPEDMLQRQPNVILRAAHGMPEEVAESFAKEFKENDIWKHFAAVQSGAVYDLDYTLFNMSANLKYTDSLLYLKQLFYS